VRVPALRFRAGCLMLTIDAALRGGPELVRKTEMDLWEAKKKRDLARLRAKMRESDIALYVAQERTADGTKKKYSNADEREGAARTILQTDAAYNDAMREVDELEVLVARIEAALGFHVNVQRNARILALARSPFDLAFDTAELAG
jgi:hypothetical protein